MPSRRTYWRFTLWVAMVLSLAFNYWQSNRLASWEKYAAAVESAMQTLIQDADETHAMMVELAAAHAAETEEAEEYAARLEQSIREISAAFDQAQDTYGKVQTTTAAYISALQARLNELEADADTRARRTALAQREKEEYAAWRAANQAAYQREQRAVATLTSGTVPESSITAAVRARVKRWCEAERRNGSGATLVFEVETEIETTRPVRGWDGRFEVTGVAHYQYYDSIWGGSFSAKVRPFRCLVETRTGAPRVTEIEQR